MKTQQGFDIYNGDISRSKAADKVRSCPIKRIHDLWIYQRSRSKNKTHLQPIQRRHWEKFAESSSIKHKLWRLYIKFPDENTHRVASDKRSPQSGILYIYVTNLQRTLPYNCLLRSILKHIIIIDLKNKDYGRSFSKHIFIIDLKDKDYGRSFSKLQG